MQEYKSNRQISHKAEFCHMIVSPFTVGLSLWMYHPLHSEKAINIMNRCAAGVSYDYLTHICGRLAKANQQNVEEHGVYIPHGMLKNISIRASADNVDKKVDTYDAKNSFHAMAMCVHQNYC